MSQYDAHRTVTIRPNGKGKTGTFAATYVPPHPGAEASGGDYWLAHTLSTDTGKKGRDRFEHKKFVGRIASRRLHPALEKYCGREVPRNAFIELLKQRATGTRITFATEQHNGKSYGTATLGWFHLAANADEDKFQDMCDHAKASGVTTEEFEDTHEIDNATLYITLYERGMLPAVVTYKWSTSTCSTTPLF